MTPGATFIAVDCETGGKDPERHEVLEIAAVATDPDATLGMLCHLVAPTRPVPPAAAGIHGLTEAYVRERGALPFDVARNRIRNFIDRFRDPVVVFHNAPFDQSFLQLEYRTLCTLRLARHLWPDLADDEDRNYKLGTLRICRELVVDDCGIAAHRALGDALVTAALLREQLNSLELGHTDVDDVDGLIEYANSPLVIRTLPFGKYYGKPVSAADTGWLQWALLDADRVKNDPDLKFTIEQEVRRRRGAAA